MILAIAARLASGIVATALAAAVLVAAVAVAPAGAQTLKPWRHGIIAPKSDAGFLLMAARRGFAEREGLRLELLEVKDDQIGLKALLSGELDSYEGGVQGAIAANIHGADVTECFKTIGGVNQRNSRFEPDHHKSFKLALWQQYQPVYGPNC